MQIPGGNAYLYAKVRAYGPTSAALKDAAGPAWQYNDARGLPYSKERK